MIRERLFAVIVVGAACVLATGAATAQGTGAAPGGAPGGAKGGDCVFRPANGGDAVPVANGATYTPPFRGAGRGTTNVMPKFQCKDGKLVRVE